MCIHVVVLTLQTHFRIPKISRGVCKGLGFQHRLMRLKNSLRETSGSPLVKIVSKIKHDYGFISLVTQQGHEQLPHQRHFGATSRTTTLLPTHHSIILCRKVGTTNTMKCKSSRSLSEKMLYRLLKIPLKIVTKQVAGSLGDPKITKLHI